MKVLLRKYFCCPGVQGLLGLLPADDDRHGVHRVPALCLPHHCRCNFLTLLSPTPTSTQPVGNLEKTVFGNNFQTKLGEVRSVNIDKHWNVLKFKLTFLFTIRYSLLRVLCPQVVFCILMAMSAAGTVHRVRQIILIPVPKGFLYISCLFSRFLPLLASSSQLDR